MEKLELVIDKYINTHISAYNCVTLCNNSHYYVINYCPTIIIFSIIIETSLLLFFQMVFNKMTQNLNIKFPKKRVLGKQNERCQRITENCPQTSCFRNLYCFSDVLSTSSKSSLNLHFWELQKNKFVQYLLLKVILDICSIIWLTAPFPLITLWIWCPYYVSITLLRWLKDQIIFFFPPLWSQDYLLVSMKACADTKCIKILVMQHHWMCSSVVGA